MCRVQSDGIVEGEMRFIRRCQVRSSATKRSRRAIVSRETSNIARAFWRSALRSIAMSDIWVIARDCVARKDVQASDVTSQGVNSVVVTGPRTAVPHLPEVTFAKCPRRTNAASSTKAAGVIPSRRPAWPIVRGRAAASFCLTSLESPGTAA